MDSIGIHSYKRYVPLFPSSHLHIPSSDVHPSYLYRSLINKSRHNHFPLRSRLSMAPQSSSPHMGTESGNPYSLTLYPSPSTLLIPTD